MRRVALNPRWAVWAALLAVAFTCGNILGQAPAPATVPAAAPAAAPQVDTKLADLWNNFLYYILLARPAVALSHGKAILDSNPDPRQLYQLSVETDKSGATLARGRGMKELAPTVDKMVALIEQGALAVRTDAPEIARWIKMLGGTPRQMMIATERLVHSGQYAVPQLIAAMEDPDTSQELQMRLTNVLPRLGKGAVRPLCEALQTKEQPVREVVARILGKIGYRHAAPYLRQLVIDKEMLVRTRRTAELALAACAGRNAMNKPPAELFYDLGQSYYKRAESVNSDARYDTANVWYWQEGLGVTYKVVPRVIFNEIYAMRCARKALAHDSKFDPAIPLWIAAYLRKEGNLGDENARRKAANLAQVGDPTQPAGRPGPAYYAKAAGAKYLQSVLKRGLTEPNLAVAVGAIAALRDTTGAQNLITTMDRQGGAQPLVAALNSSTRLVRYMAAETLALARPNRRFTGSHLVVPRLVEAVRQSGAMAVVLADPDLDHRNKVKDLLRTAACRVFDADSFGQALQAAQDAGGVDACFIATDIAGPGFKEAVIRLRAEEVLSRLPLVALAKPAETITAREMAKTDTLLLLLPEDKTDAAGVQEVLKKISELVRPLPPDEAADWAIRAAAALRMLADTGNAVYDLTVAVQPLIAALADKRDPVRIAAARALAPLGSAQAQRAVADLADDDAAGEEVRLAAYAYLSESVRLFGNQLTEKQIKAIIDVVTAAGSLKLREGAAQALGALNLPSEKVKELIVTNK